VLPKNVGARIDIGRIPVPPVFQWLASAGGIAEKEMLRTFNCGIGMVVVLESKQADAALAVLRSAGEDARIIGEVRRGDGGVSFGS
jgi:phosphoribosylformylglycinamidine cyclo-ligase